MNFWPFGMPRLDLPLALDRTALFLPWLFALMVYVAALAGTGLVLIEEAGQAARDRLTNAATVEIPADASDARLQTALALLRQTPGIAAVQLLDGKETARLLEPWLGPSVKLDELPIPRLIDLRLDPGSGADFAALRRQLMAIVPDARVEDHGLSLQGIDAAARAGERILAAMIVLTLLLVGVLAAFASRTGLASGHTPIELLHLLGAADRDIAGQLAMRSLGLGLLGGAIGAVATLITIAASRGIGRLVELAAPVTAIGVADWRLWLVLAGTIAAVGLIAMASTRLIVQRHLAGLP